MANLRQALYAWRDNEASRKGVEGYRILPNSSLDEIVKALPRTRDELIAIKGIKDAKYHAYGKTLLEIVDQYGGIAMKESDATKGDSMQRIGMITETVDKREVAAETNVFSVGNYLDIVNAALWRFSARVRGEIVSVKSQGSAVYMSMKDKDDESVMSVFMWTRDFEACGVEVTEGLEVVVEGRSEVYKPSGRLSFRAETIELVGEGALKRAYDALKKRLEGEGLFAPERKRPLPEFPERLGLVTSKQGAVIHDFLNNLGKYGFKIRFTDARVEGIAAVKELLAALKYFSDKDIDALVLIRGGGSFESLAAFNHETLVRAIAAFPKPVICAIGHDKDVPLAQLVADLAPSTPTATTALLNASWQDAESSIALMERSMVFRLEERILAHDAMLTDVGSRLERSFEHLSRLLSDAALSVFGCVPLLGNAIERLKGDAREAIAASLRSMRQSLVRTKDEVAKLESTIASHDPVERLRLGYSILSRKEGILKSVKELKRGDIFRARLSDGTLKARIEDIETEHA